jgi:hypothetical protein
VALKDACRKWAAEAQGEATEVRAEEDQLLWNGVALPRERAPVARLHEAMRKRLIASVTADEKATDEDLRRLVSLLAEDPERLMAQGGARRALGGAGSRIQVEDVDFAGHLRESEALWLEACSRLETPVMERLQDAFDCCVRTLRLLGDASTTSGAVSSPTQAERDGEAEDEEDLSAEDTVAIRLACLIQSAGELAYFSDEGYWRGWQESMRRELAALGPEWMGRVLRSPSGRAPGHPDMLALMVREMDPEACVAAVLGYHGAIRSEPSKGLGLVLARIMPDEQRQQEIEPLLHREAQEQGISEEVYRNVVGTLVSQVGPTGALGGPGAGAPGGGQWDEDLAELVATATPESARWSHLEVLGELLEAELDLGQYGRILSVLSEKAQQYAQEGDQESSRRALQELRRAARREGQEDPGRRAMAAGALVRSGSAGVVAAVLSEIRAAPAKKRSELAGLLGSLGEEGMAALVSLARQPRSPFIADVLRVVVQQEGRGSHWLRRLLAEAPADNLQELMPAVLATGDGRVVSQLIALTDHPSLPVRLELARLLALSSCPEAVAVLVQMLGDAAPQVRTTVAKALGDLCAEEAVPALCNIATRRSPRSDSVYLRETAIAALGAIGSEAAVHDLGEILTGRRDLLILFRGSRLRLAAAAALEKIGGYQAFKALEQGARAHSRAVREACRRAVARLSSSSQHTPRGVADAG